LAETTFDSYTPTGPNSNWVASKYRHNEHIVEYELCHRNIVDKKLMNERATFPFESIDLPPNDRQSIASNPASYDFLPSESNLNTAIHHDDDGFSDSDDDWMIGASKSKQSDEINNQLQSDLPKPNLPQQNVGKSDSKPVEEIPVIDLESWEESKSVQNVDHPIPKNTPKRTFESMKEFLKNQKKKSTSPKNRPSKMTPKVKRGSNEGQKMSKVQRLKTVEDVAKSDLDSWDSDFYQNCKNASQDKNHPRDQNDDRPRDESRSRDENSSSSSLMKDTSGNLFCNSEDDFDSEDDEDFLELTRTKIEPNHSEEKIDGKVSGTDVIVIDSDNESTRVNEKTKSKKPKQQRLSQYFRKK